MKVAMTHRLEIASDTPADVFDLTQLNRTGRDLRGRSGRYATRRFVSCDLPIQRFMALWVLRLG